MRQRYGGYGALPSALLIARNAAGDVVACAGLEMALLRLLRGHPLRRETRDGDCVPESSAGTPP